MTKIAEAYMRLDIRLDRRDKIEFKQYLEKQAHIYAAELFHQDVTFVVHVEDGSVKAWVLVGGILFTNALVQYGSVRTGMDYAIRDARYFSENVLNDIKSSGVSPNEIGRFERRLGVPGRLKRIFNRIDNLKKEGRNLSKTEYDREFSLIRKQLIKTLDQIDNRNDLKLVRNSLPRVLESSLPESPRLPVKQRMPTIALRPEEYYDVPEYLSLTHKGTSPSLTHNTSWDKDYKVSLIGSRIKFISK